MKRTGAALAGIGVFLVGQALTAAPAAKADCAPGSCYAAIAYSPSRAFARSDHNNPTQEIADRDAVAGCNAQGNANDCIVVARGMQCLALATIPSGQDEFYNAGVGPTKAAADAAALAGHPGWTIQIDDCNG
jgi:hypothetical protein